MKPSEQAAIFLAGGLVLGAGARVLVPEAHANPYQGIVERNVFALKPAPRSEDTPPPKPPTPPIELQGFTTMFGRPQVLFSTTAPGSKPGQPPQKVSMALGVGQRDGDIEVLEIDVKAGTVKFNNHGTEEVKDLATDGVKAPAGAVPAPFAGISKPAIPGAPAMPAIPNPHQGGGGVVTTLGTAGSSLRNIPSRTPRGPMAPGGVVPAATAAPQPQKGLTPEEQVIYLEALRAANDPNLPPVPPTQFTPPPTPQ